ncbi:MAG: protein DpdE [Cyanobacteria bacterium P01_A01_bin.45]
MNMIQIGSLVRSKTNSLGIGKAVQVAGTQAIVEYFCSVAQRIKKSLPLSSLSPVQLQPQARCYIWDERQNNWHIGRVYQWDEDSAQYQIDLPDSQTAIAVEQDIYVRCNIIVADPIETLVMKGQETPYFHNKRLKLMECLVKQRAVSCGMTGLISANIKLYPHQVEVIRRVVSDSVQRYLLADEVGLGKNVEAGVILRQYLLDESKDKALVLVPQSLRSQWQQELEEKIYISHFPNRVKVYAIEDLDKVDLSAEFGLVIIDQAQNVAAMARSSLTSEQDNFQLCRQIVHDSDRLLLLSSIPVLGNEQDFLTMMHLLDPTTYNINDLQGLVNRIEERYSVGEALLPLQAQAEASTLKTSLNRLQKFFTEDEYFLNLTEELQSNLQSNSQNTQKTGKIIHQIRTYVSNTYRLHRRMLRNRRSAVEDVIFNRDITPKLEYDLDERSFDIHEYLENWRINAPKSKLYGQIFQLIFRARSTWLGILRQVVTSRLSKKSSESLIREFGEESIKTLIDTQLFPGEEEILQRLLQIIRQPSEDGDRLELLKILILYRLSENFGLQSWRSDLKKLLSMVQQRLKRPTSGDKLPKIAIFTSFIGSGSEIFRYMGSCFGEKAVASHLVDQSPNQAEDNIQRFKNNPNCFILICDPSAQKYRNMQFIEWMIHFDLPSVPNELEERISRIDRVGRPFQIESTIFAGAEVDESPHDAWYQVLKDGFHVFEKSIANLGFYIDNKQTELETILFESGANGLLETIPTIQAEIAEAQIKIDQQNILDEIDVSDENTNEYFQELDDYDARHQEIQNSVEGWICQALQLQQREDINIDRVVRYSATPRTLIPANQIKSLFAKHLKHSGTYNRRISTQSKGIKLYRIGEGLTDAIASHIRWDDRGQVFAIWRANESWGSGKNPEWFGFRFDYVVEANLKIAKQILKESGLDMKEYKSLQRLAEGLFPPLVETVFLDCESESMAIVEDEELLKILQREYHGKGSKNNRDYNLAKNRLKAIDEFVPPSEWENTCRRARQTSEELLANRPDFVDLCKKRTAIAKRELGNRINQMQMRLTQFSQSKQMSNSLLAREIDSRSELNEAILQGIRHPNIRLDSVGFVIVSGQPPVQSEDDDD